MDLTLLYWAITLVVVGFLVGLLGLFVNQRETRGVAEEEELSLTDMVVKALQELFTAVPKMFRGNRWGPRIQAFGSVLAWLGVALFVVFVIGAIGGGDGDGESPSPAAS
jgi:hypothetical protein